MKNLLIVLLLLNGAFDASAQYKKSQLLTKNGRTYDLGIGAGFPSQGVGVVPTLNVGFGRDKQKTVFHWFDFELMAPASFSYVTTDANANTPISVSGKTSPALSFGYNFAVHLAKASNEEIKFQPFFNAGLYFLLLGNNASKISYSDDQAGIPKRIVMASYSYFIANAGLGGIYNLKPTLGLKFSAGYNYSFNGDRKDYLEQYEEVFEIHPSNIYVKIGLRFLMGD